MAATAAAMAAAIVAVVALPQPAQAGGVAPAVPVVPVVVEDAAVAVFDGVYVGGALGYAFQGEDRVGIFPPGGSPENRVGTLDLQGAFGDLHIGRWWQRDRLVYGLELGVQAGGPDDSIREATGEASNKMKYALTLRGMLGRQVADATMVYGFAGISSGKFDYKAVDGTADIRDEITMTGYVVGLGVEHALDAHWSLRGELQQAVYGKKKLSDAAGNYTHPTPKFTAIALGVNYRF